MNEKTDPPLENQLAAALDWWRAAGVDCAYDDEPRSWLRAKAVEEASSDASPAKPGAKRKAAQPSEPQQPRIGGDPSRWPQDLAAFRNWWLAEPSLDPGGNHLRLAPRGEAGAELMVLVPMPEIADRDSLLSGREGRLLENMLAAMGLSRERTYVAAALPAHLVEPDWTSLAQEGLGTVLLHHLVLVKPKRLLVLGRGVLPLLGHSSAQAPAAINETTIQTGETSEKVPTLVGIAPGLLLENARQRAMLWRRWLEWTDARQ